MSKLLRVKQAAEYLNVTPQTIRNWSNNGTLQHSLTGAGQRIFTTQDLDNYKNTRLGITPTKEQEKPTIIIHYARTSNKQDISLKNQLQKLENTYGKPHHTITDTNSGLNDNRKGLNKLFNLITQPGTYQIHITNKDRLTRFGYNYLEYFFKTHNTTITTLEDNTTKEPLEILLQDFMNLLASFSGKFYRLRGHEQQTLLLQKAEEVINNKKEVNNHQNTQNNTNQTIQNNHPTH